jgi:hypothetical protein
MDSSTVVYSNADEWANAMFGKSELGDARRTKRAVDYAARQAANPGGTTHEVCAGDDAAAEAAYRLMRNDAVEPEALEAGPFQHNAALCAFAGVVLAIQDTTTLTYSHAVSEQLGVLGAGRGFIVHSTLAVDGETKQVIGLLDQQRWSRPVNEPKQKRQKKQKVPYEERESYKWERASQRIDERLGTMDNVIQVCDREGDIYEYLKERTDHEHRYVVRACYDRNLAAEQGHLWSYMDTRPVIGHYEILIGQRGAESARLGRGGRPARQARTAKLELRTAQVLLRSPADGQSFIPVNVVYTREIEPPDGEKPLEWMILTSEPIETQEQAKTVIEYYECRWLIEEFHKAWKTGCTIEQRRLQSPANLERLAVITAHVAVRLLQLRCLSNEVPERPADDFLDRDELECLYRTTHPNRPVPKSLSLRAVLLTIAKLGGWRDTKRTGRIGWMTFWKGWIRFQERLVGWKVAKESDKSISEEAEM